MAGHTAVNSIEGFLVAIAQAFHQASLNFTGQNLGAGQYKRMKKAC